MQYLIYAVSVVSIVLGLGGVRTYQDSKHIGLLLGSLIYIASGVLAISLVHWWPLLLGFVAAWGLRLLGLDPTYQR